MKITLTLLLTAQLAFLVACITSEKGDAERFRNVDLNPNSTYKTLCSQFGRPANKHSCENGVITTDCANVDWPSGGILYGFLISSKFHANYSTFTDYTVKDDAKPVWLRISPKFLGSVCGVPFSERRVKTQAGEPILSFCAHQPPFWNYNGALEWTEKSRAGTIIDEQNRGPGTLPAPPVPPFGLDKSR